MKNRKIVVPKVDGVFCVGDKLKHELPQELYYVYTVSQYDFELLWNENIFKFINHSDACLDVDDFKDTVVKDPHVLQKVKDSLDVLEVIVSQNLKLSVQKIIFLLKQALERKTCIIFSF